MVIRSVVPRLQQLSCRALLPFRHYCSHRGGPRLVPMWGPWRSMMNQFLNDPPPIISHKFKEMEKMMGRFMSPRWWDEGFIRTSAGKELEVKHDNKVFEVKLDVSDYKPEDIQVTVNDTDSKLVISGKHQEKPDDHGFISREFNRQIYIPENVEIENIESLFTHDGYIVVRANVKGAENVKERVINIQTEEPKGKHCQEGKEKQCDEGKGKHCDDKDHKGKHYEYKGINSYKHE